MNFYSGSCTCRVETLRDTHKCTHLFAFLLNLSVERWFSRNLKSCLINNKPLKTTSVHSLFQENTVWWCLVKWTKQHFPLSHLLISCVSRLKNDSRENMFKRLKLHWNTPDNCFQVHGPMGMFCNKLHFIQRISACSNNWSVKDRRCQIVSDYL